MGKKRRILVAALLVAVLVGLAWLVLSSREQEPIYEGKSLDVWLLGYRSVEPPNYEKAVEITRQAGTNAIPTLLRMLRAQDPPLKRNVMDFIQSQSSYRINYIGSDIRNCAAANACEELGVKAKAAVPTLIQLLNHDDSHVRSAATNALKKIDPEAATKAGIK